MTRTSIKKKIFLIMTVLIMFCSAAVVIYHWQQDKEESIADLKVRLQLTAESHAHELNDTLHNVEQSVETMAVYAQAQLDSVEKLGKDKEFRDDYTARMLELFNLIAENTDGAVAIYIRFNPDIAPATSGFFCQRESENGKFISLSPTPISDYEKDDVGHVGWYWIPVEKKQATWLDPY